VKFWAEHIFKHIPLIRRLAQTKECVIEAYPNPIPDSGVEITLKWQGGTAEVEIRVGAPNGELFASGSHSGMATTGPWVCDGMIFYLQDKSHGKHLTNEATLATVTINLDSRVEIPWFPSHKKIVANIVKEQMGEMPLSVQTIPVTVIEDRLVCRISFPSRTVYFKAAKQHNEIAVEAWALHKVGEIGVPAPKLFVIDLTEEHFRGAYIILEAASGVPLSHHMVSKGVRQQILREAGRYLKLIHSISLEGFGVLEIRKGEPLGAHQSWCEAMMEGLDETFKVIEYHRLLDQATLDWCRMRMDQLGDVLPAGGEGRLLHGDLSQSHIFANNNQAKLAGFIDFGCAWAGDPFWDLSLLGYDSGKDNLSYLLEGYALEPRLKKELERIFPFYIILHALHMIRYGDISGKHNIKSNAIKVICSIKDARESFFTIF